MKKERNIEKWFLDTGTQNYAEYLSIGACY